MRRSPLNGRPGRMPTTSDTGRSRAGCCAIASGVPSGSSRSRASGRESSPAATRSSAARGFGRTADGRLEVAGPARESEAVHYWKLTGESGAYRGAHGTTAGARHRRPRVADHRDGHAASRDGPARRGDRPSGRQREPRRARRSDLHPRVSTAGGAPTVPVPQLRSAASRSRAAAPGRRVLHRPG